MAIRIRFNISETLAQVQAAVSGLVLVNLAQLETVKLPPLYESGVRYKMEKPGHEQWQTIVELFGNKSGDCEDLCAARCAQLRHAGENASINVKLVRNGLMHIRVRRGNGDLEDPSKLLGM